MTTLPEKPEINSLASDLTPQQEKALLDFCETFASGAAQVMRDLDKVAIGIENLRLALPTEDIRVIRQTATDAIDRVMSK